MGNKRIDIINIVLISLFGITIVVGEIFNSISLNIYGKLPSTSETKEILTHYLHHSFRRRDYLQGLDLFYGIGFLILAALIGFVFNLSRKTNDQKKLFGIKAKWVYLLFFLVVFVIGIISIANSISPFTTQINMILNYK